MPEKNSGDHAGMLHMIVEQTKDHPRRMIYDPATGSFSESDRQSLLYERHFSMPYGWIKESGTPPGNHWDCILMSREDCRLGDEIEVEVIGLFRLPFCGAHRRL